MTGSKRHYYLDTSYNCPHVDVTCTIKSSFSYCLKFDEKFNMDPYFFISHSSFTKYYTCFSEFDDCSNHCQVSQFTTSLLLHILTDICGLLGYGSKNMRSIQLFTIFYLQIHTIHAYITEKDRNNDTRKTRTSDVGFTIKRGKAGKRGSSSLTSLTEGTRPLSRYSLKTKPVGNTIENLSQSYMAIGMYKMQLLVQESKYQKNYMP